MNHDEILFLLAGAVLAVATVALLSYLSRRTDNDWRFVDMLVSHAKDGSLRASRDAFVHLGAFFVSSAWGTWLAYNHELTEWFFGSYMLAWAGVGVARQIAAQKKDV